jgi:hypothetical protein
MRSILWRQSEIIRRLVGNSIQAISGAFATAAAANVAMGDGDRLVQKLNDACVLPDLMANYHRARYLWDHYPQIEKAVTYLNEKMPTPDQISQMGAQAQHAYQQWSTFTGHLAAAKVAAVGWHLSDAYTHIVGAVELLPSIPAALSQMSALTKHASDVLAYVTHVPMDPLYQAMKNIADNFSYDEIAITIGIILIVTTVSLIGGAYLGGIWSNRGIPGLFMRWRMKRGFSHHKDWYSANIEEVIRAVYGDEMWRAVETRVLSKHSQR